MKIDRLKSCAIGLVLLAAFGAGPVHALDFSSPEWGFGGHVVPMAYNPVTIQVLNNSAEPYEGDIALVQGRMGSGGVPMVERGLYIEPGGSRRIQFFPYIADQWSEFSLRWGPGLEQRAPLLDETTSLRFGSPATVLMRDSTFLSRTNIGLPTFDEEVFPISVAGTDGLKAVVLDHVPRWDGLRMQAFRDWVAAGGTVHLFLNERGEHPKFPPPLEALNEPSDAISLVAGRVYRYARPVASIDKAFIADTLGVTGPEQVANAGDPRRGFQYDYQWSVSNAISPLLRSLTRPDHNWALIYVLSFAYLAVVFPGCWLLGRKRADFRITYPVLLSAVALFSWAFKIVGQRGYGEQTAWNSVTIAQPLGEGRWLTEGWSNAFVTNGGKYSFQHNADGLIYATASDDDVRHGETVNRPNASCTLDIPPFSSQTLLHSGVMSGVPLEIELTAADPSTTPPTFQFTMKGELPPQFTAHAIHGSTALTVHRDGSQLKTLGATPLSQLVQVDSYSPYRYGGFNMQDSPETIYESAKSSLIADTLKIGSDQTRDAFTLPADRVKLLVYAPAPAPFLEVKGGPEKRNGWVLYAFDFNIPPTDLSATETPAATSVEP